MDQYAIAAIVAAGVGFLVHQSLLKPGWLGKVYVSPRRVRLLEASQDYLMARVQRAESATRVLAYLVSASNQEVDRLKTELLAALGDETQSEPPTSTYPGRSGHGT